jgi:hypothetical protein
MRREHATSGVNSIKVRRADQKGHQERQIDLECDYVEAETPPLQCVSDDSRAGYHCDRCGLIERRA